MTDHELLETLQQRLHTYVAEHPGCQEAELKAYLKVLEAATPGLRDAIGCQAMRTDVLAALISDRGDGLPSAGPTEAYDVDGELLWKMLDQWTLADFRLNLAWWHRRPGCPAPRLAALIAYGEQRWPGEDLSRQPWPETHHLPAWGPILAAEVWVTEEEPEAPDA